MRSRTVREGSVGLLLLAGLGLFLGLILWLRGVSLGRRSYKVVVEFANVGGMQTGAVVRYRGVKVGNISAIRPKANRVEAEIEIIPATLIMPRDVLIQANQLGLLSDVSIDITPQKQLATETVAAKPLDKSCDQNLIICDGSRLQGEIGISLDQVLRSTTELANTYSDPTFFANLNAAAKNASVAATGVAQLTRDFSSLARTTERQIGSISTTANSVQRLTNQLGASTNQVAVSANRTTAQIGATAEQIRVTAAQANRLVSNIDNLVTTNRTSLVSALDNITQTSDELRTTVNRVNQTKLFDNLETLSANAAQLSNRINQGQLLQNLENLSANAAQASANLRDVSNSIGNPTNVLVLQQTLDSARLTFENAQKITSDLDELTGDPTFRRNVRDLVNGLSGLVSSTQQLQQQIQVAQKLESVKATANIPEVTMPSPAASELYFGDGTQKFSNPSSNKFNSTGNNGTPTFGADREAVFTDPAAGNAAFSFAEKSLKPPFPEATPAP